MSKRLTAYALILLARCKLLEHERDTALAALKSMEAQVIGEQTPVVIKDSEVFTACETYADNYPIEGRITTSPKAMRMALKKFMEGRSPMSSEAREKAVEALKAAHREAQESRKHFSPSDLDRIHIESLVVQLSEALSALRG